MGVRKYQDLIAWQMAQAFASEIIELLKRSPGAAADRRYASQLLSAAQSVPANVAEGFLRKSPGDFRRFLRIGLGSLGEAEGRLGNGIQMGYFSQKDCEAAFRFARRCAVAASRLADCQLEFASRPVARPHWPPTPSANHDSNPENPGPEEPEDPST